MEPSASGEVFNSDPQPEQPEEVETKRPRRQLIVVVLAVMLALFVVVVYFSFVRKAGSTNGNNSETSQEAQKTEYKNLNGFQIQYPSNFALTETVSGAKLTGESDIEFLVKPTEEPLAATVSKKAQELGIKEDSSEFSTESVNSRTGYLLSLEGKQYHFFPLFGSYYLEIVVGDAQKASEVMSSLEFTPPQASLQ
jgi:hypothetical protein